MMKPLALASCAVSILLAFASAARGEVSDAPAPEKVLSDADLDRLESDLEIPAQRLPAIAALAEFGALKLYRVGSVIMYQAGDDARTNERRERAAKLAASHRDLPTVRGALDSDDPRLQFWGLVFWNAGFYQARSAGERNPMVDPARGATAEEEAWNALRPKLRRLARVSVWRGKAIDDLATAGSETEFLRSLIPEEKDAGVILRLLDYTVTRRGLDNSERDRLFNVELLRLLGDASPTVRQAALGDIWFNPDKAAMYHVQFSPAVLSRVREFQASPDPEDRRLAEQAIESLGQKSAVGEKP